MNVRKVEASEAAKWNARKATNKGIRAATRAQYDELLKGFTAGEGAEFGIEQGETKITVRKHIAAAADRAGLVADFRRGKKDTIKVAFLAKPDSADVTEPATEPAAE